MKTMKNLLIAMLCLTMILGCFGCQKQATPAAAAATDAPAVQDDWSYIKEKGKLVVGITEYAPMNYYDESGKLIGFDTEFAEAVAAKLGVDVEFIVIIWENKELELSSKTIDCIWNGLTVTEERKANMDFTNSYLTNEQVVVVRAAELSSYTNAASFKGKAVVAEEGSAGATAIEADLPDAAFTAVEAQSDALLEVKAGTADAAVIDVTMAKAMVGAGTDYSDLAIVTAVDMMDEEYAIGFRTGSAAVAKFNEVIKELQGDGTLAAIAEKYALTDLYIAG